MADDLESLYGKTNPEEGKKKPKKKKSKKSDTAQTSSDYDESENWKYDGQDDGNDEDEEQGFKPEEPR